MWHSCCCYYYTSWVRFFFVCLFVFFLISPTVFLNVLSANVCAQTGNLDMATHRLFFSCVDYRLGAALACGDQVCGRKSIPFDRSLQRGQQRWVEKLSRVMRWIICFRIKLILCGLVTTLGHVNVLAQFSSLNWVFVLHGSASVKFRFLRTVLL